MAYYNQNDMHFAEVVPAGDYQGLAEAVQRIITDKDYATELAENAFAVGKKYFDVQSVVAQLHDV